MSESTTESQLAQTQAMLALTQEALADVERVMRKDEAGWDALGSFSGDLDGFTAQFRKDAASRALVAVVADPLIRRGVALRGAYIWGGGVQISVRDDPGQGQDVNAVVQAFLDDADNLATFSDTEARIEMERQLGISGEIPLCLPTDPTSGRVRVRLIPAHQITEIISDPEDEATEWFYRRRYVVGTESREVLYPSLNHRPAQRAHSLDGTPIRWDAPIKFIRVNRVRGRGLGDTFAAIPWARAYKRFLESWAQLTASLARFAYQLKTRGDRTAQAAAHMARAAAGEAGQNLTSDPNTYLEAVGKSGATIDSDSGRPLAAMAAAALDIPVTTLLGDPGVTGARAVAADVTDSSWALFDVRRAMWAAVIRDICSYVIDAAVIAPAGPLRGTIVRDGNRQTATLPEGDGRTVIVDWPDRDSVPMLDRVKALQLADQSERIPPLVIAREMLQALGVENADEILKQITDDQGNFVPLDVIDARVRARLADRGEAA